MTITSIGYGDVSAAPYNAAEQIVCTSLMLLSGILWGYVIGTFCGAIANLSPQTYEFRRNMVRVGPSGMLAPFQKSPQCGHNSCWPSLPLLLLGLFCSPSAS